MLLQIYRRRHVLRQIIIRAVQTGRRRVALMKPRIAKFILALSTNHSCTNRSHSTPLALHTFTQQRPRTNTASSTSSAMFGWIINNRHLASTTPTRAMTGGKPWLIQSLLLKAWIRNSLLLCGPLYWAIAILNSILLKNKLAQYFRQQNPNW